ncbi:hypothetical protein Poly30_51250 [Planctomycetes bacterium Poly30]|uniref:Right handed beta helix domain-containing protein n=2 Tax=Saltatorellus ferox TaxID=2528018 RepID=A0A518EZP4_9BACT|nr:hypothetical protein Poly30_51250 [Planctomycetes bacterium Poly30]
MGHLANRLLLLGVALAASLQSSAAAGEILRIAANGTGDYFSIADAYAAAAEGDTLLIIGAPLDTRVQVDGKAVDVVMTSALSHSLLQVSVRNLGAGKTVYIRGIHYGGLLAVEDCAGSVIIADSSFGFGWLLRNDSVAMVRTTIEGNGASSAGAPNDLATFHVNDTSVLVSQSELNGQVGEYGQCGSGICTTCCYDGGPGYNTLRVTGSSYMRVQASTIYGGPGGPVVGGLGFCPCSSGADGLSYSVDSGATLQLLETTTYSGTGSNGHATQLSGTARRVDTPVSADGGSSFQLLISGDPGDTAYLLAGGDLIFRPTYWSAGIIQVNGALGRRRLGSIPPGGVLSVPLTAPPVASGQVEPLLTQVVLLLANGEIRLAPAGIVQVRGAGVAAW